MKPDSSRNVPPQQTAASHTPLKPYQKPCLRVYGDLAAITGTLKDGTVNDGSGHPNMHFTS